MFMVSLCPKDLLKKIKTSQQISRIWLRTLEWKGFEKTQDSRCSCVDSGGITLDEFTHIPAPNPIKKSKPNHSKVKNE
jgi:hypothetical protein